MERTQLFKIVVSFGSVSSSISLPCYMSHASIPADVRAARGLPDDLVRISVGIEDPRDLIRGELLHSLLCSPRVAPCMGLPGGLPSAAVLPARLLGPEVQDASCRGCS